jgi:hypothetical protein
MFFGEFVSIIVNLKPAIKINSLPTPVKYGRQVHALDTKNIKLGGVSIAAEDVDDCR